MFRLMSFESLISASFLSLGCSLDQWPWSNDSRAFMTAWSTSSLLQAAILAIT